MQRALSTTLALLPLLGALPARAEPAPAVLERIEIQGNDETRDHVIRRELTLRPGDRYDRARLEEDLKRVYKLNFYDSVELSEAPGSTPEQRVAVVKVKEKQTWMVFPGAAWTSLDGLIVSTNTRKDNLFGHGQTVTADVYLSKNYSFYLSYLDPWVGADKTTLESYLSFARSWNNFAALPGPLDPAGAFPGVISERLSASVYLGKPLFGDSVTTKWSGMLALKPERIALRDFSEVPVSGKPFFASGKDADVVVATSAQLTYDSRDNNLYPRDGVLGKVLIDQYVPGVSATDLTKVKLDLSRYVPLWGGASLALAAKAGHMFSISGQELPVYERYFSFSEQLVRGWPESPSPAQRAGYPGGSFAGDSYLMAGAEVRVPIVWIFAGALFAESGLFWDQRIGNLALDRTRSGYGVGLRANLPALGPLRLDYGLRDGNLGAGQVQIAINYKF